MHLAPHIRQDLTVVLDHCTSGDDALEQAARFAADQLPHVEAEVLIEELRSRESQYPTATREGVAFPHVLLSGVEETVIVACLIRPSVRWSVAQEAPQELMFLMIGPDAKPWQHVRLLARLARIVSTEGALERLRGARDAQDLFERLVQEDQDHA